MKTFAELGVPKAVTAALTRRGITAPFPIQAATVADALAGRDVCGRAPTGSGKTLAFSIPVAVNTRKGSTRAPRALILVPTRELAAQVCETLRPLAQARDLGVAAFYGGTSIGKDIAGLRRGVDIAVACPGRLADLVNRGAVTLQDVDVVVLDEADRMADMGFLPEVRRLLDATSPTRQTLLFSATLDGDVDVLIRHYQRDPVRHQLVEVAGEAGDVRHLFWTSEPHLRVDVTSDIVRTMDSAIVFTRTKHGADRVARQLSRKGTPAVAIHGNRTQRQREKALADFTSGRVGTLVATDVAARGIHVDDVGVVVHFDPPTTDKDYVHRSGRTGRAGADGLVVTLVVPEKINDVKGLQRALAMPQGVGAVSLSQLTDATAGIAGPGDDPAPVAPPKRPADDRRERSSQRSRGAAQSRGQGKAGARSPSGRPDRQRRSPSR